MLPILSSPELRVLTFRATAWQWYTAASSPVSVKVCQVDVFSGWSGSWSIVWWRSSPSTPDRLAIAARICLSCSNRSSSSIHYNPETEHSFVVGWLVDWCLTALSAQTGYIMP